MLSACEQGPPPIDHFAVAEAAATRIKAAQGKEDFSAPDWDAVADELALVPAEAPNHVKAEEWRAEILKARRGKLFNSQQEPDEPVEQTARASSRSSRSSQASKPGYWEMGGNVNLADIESRVKRGDPGNGMATSSGHSGSSSRSSASKSKPSGGPLAVTLYTTSWCGVCKAAKSYLRGQGVSFVEKDIERDPSARAEKEAKAGKSSGVPVIDVNGSIMVGFDERALSQMLRRGG